MNKGKKFEKQIKASCDKQGIFLIRFNDTSLSWEHEESSRFTPESPCDYLIYSKPYLFAIECKSTCYGSMSIQRLGETGKSYMVKAHQIQSLINFSLHDGVYAGLLVNFRNDEDISDNSVYYWPIDGVSDFLCFSPKKSFNKYDVEKNGGILINQKLLRINYLYDIDKMLKDIIKEDIKRKEANDGASI